MTITIPVWALWALGITGAVLALIVLGMLLAIWLANNSGWGPWR